MQYRNSRTGPISLLALLAATIVGCSRGPAAVDVVPLEVIVAHPSKGTIDDRDIYTGTLTATKETEIRSKVTGYIKEVVFNERKSEEVKAGDVLFRIDAEPFKAQLKQAEGELTTWEGKLKGAEKDVATLTPLAQKGTVSATELNKATTSRDEAIGGVGATQGKIREIKLNIEYCTVVSDIAGKVGVVEKTEGNLVQSATLLTTVVEMDPMYVQVGVNERAMLRYRRILNDKADKEKTKGMPVIPVDMALADDPDFPHKGFVEVVDNRVDPKTGAIRVRAIFDNKKLPNGSRPLTVGLFARLRVNIGGAREGMLLPDRAILSDQSLSYVLVVDKDKKNTVRRVDIEVSDRKQDNGLRAVLKGLTGAEWVIIDGVNRVRDGSTVTPKTPEEKR